MPKPVEVTSIRHTNMYTTIVCGDASITLHNNGEIFVNGRRAASDQEVVDGMRQLIEYFRVHEVHDA